MPQSRPSTPGKFDAMIPSMVDGQPEQSLRLGTRGSLLARMQSQMVASQLEKRHPGLRIELIICKTTGDIVQDRPLHAIGGKGLFTKELEEAMLKREIDFAVHSFKDVPVTMPLVEQGELVIASVPAREDARDVLACNHCTSLTDLSPGAKVGTASLRRKCQILAVRSDLQIDMIRGNIDTRLQKLGSQQYDAIILAMAGLKRSGMFNATYMSAMPLDQMLPAAAQGALALQCRRDDEKTQTILASLNDPATQQCVEIERQVVAELGGDCYSPIAAYASIVDEKMELNVAVGARGGELPVVRASATSPLNESAQALRAVISSLDQQGARALLAGSASR